jgi:hypothetical protein
VIGREATLLLTVLVSACVKMPLPTDKIRTGEAAINIAAKACGESDRPEGTWEAQLMDGEWDVRLLEMVASSPHRVRTADVLVRASDGMETGCNVYLYDQTIAG